LIGGHGIDEIFGGGGDDILIGGWTNFDGNNSALGNIMTEWVRNIAYVTRVQHLRGIAAGGWNLGTLLNATTVHDDFARDNLWGQADTDWFIRSPLDMLFDPVAGEEVLVV
jgi:hypothetical protein